VLAGVGQVTLAADGPASAHAGANFLIPTSGPGAVTAAAAAAAGGAAAGAGGAAPAAATAAAVAAATLQEMNPLVRVVALAGGESAVQEAVAAAAVADASTADGDDPVFGAHDLVVWCAAAGGPTALAEAARAAKACRARGRLFMGAAVSGHAGYCFCDFGPEYTYRPKENEAAGGPPAAAAAEAKAPDTSATAAGAAADAADAGPRAAPLPAERTVAFSTLAAALAAPLGGLHANAHPLFPVLCATAAVQARAPAGAPPPGGEDGARAVEAELSSGALGGSPGGAELLAAAVDLARAYVGQAGAGGGADPLLSVAREYAPAAAVVGAVAANAALRAVSRSGAPLRNVFFFSCADGRGLVEDQPALANGLAQAGGPAGKGPAAGASDHQAAGAPGATAADDAVQLSD